MNFLEAFKSGKDFKRKCHDGWFLNVPTRDYKYIFFGDDLIAEDWEVKPNKLKAWLNLYDKTVILASEDCFDKKELVWKRVPWLDEK